VFWTKIGQIIPCACQGQTSLVFPLMTYPVFVEGGAVGTISKLGSKFSQGCITSDGVLFVRKTSQPLLSLHHTGQHIWLANLSPVRANTKLNFVWVLVCLKASVIPPPWVCGQYACQCGGATSKILLRATAETQYARVIAAPVWLWGTWQAPGCVQACPTASGCMQVQGTLVLVMWTLWQ
jgi:hypothetical protein